MKLNNLFIYTTSLFTAVQRNNIEMIKILLAFNKTDVNIINILYNYFFYII